MKRAWILLLVVAAAVAAFVLLGPSKKAPVAGSGDAADGRGVDVPPPPPALRPSPPRDGATGEPATPEEPRDGEPAEEPKPEGPQITGTVVDDATEKPIAGARVRMEILCGAFPADLAALWSAGASPRVQMHVGAPEARIFPIGATTTTDEEGKFAAPWGWGSSIPTNLYVRATGYVVARACSVDMSKPQTIRLKRGLDIRGVVVRHDGAAISGAVVRAEPAPGTEILPGHADATTTDKEGKFALTGLIPGKVIVSADHPKFVPTALEPMEPGFNDVRIVLVPAFLATFHLKTDDAKQPDAPSLQWKTTGTPPRSGLQILLVDEEVAQDEAIPPEGTWKYEPVKVPCDRPDVTFELKAVGYEVWRSEPETLPPLGGEKTYEVDLRRDMTLGSLKIAFEDRDGNPISFVKDQCEVVTGRRDRVRIPAGIVVKPSDALEFPALPGGPYVFLIRSPLHAPLLLSVDVPAQRETEAKGVLGPPAKLRVKFTAPEQVIVRFRVMQGKDIAYPFPEGASVAQEESEKPGEEPKERVFHTGAEGLLLSGLADGTHTVEVLSPELVAPLTPVDLVAGETREVEIRVDKR